MSDPDFPQELRAFIRDTLPDVESLELLLLLARNRHRRLDLSTILTELRPTVVSESAVRRHLAVFRERGLVIEMKEDNYQYYPVLPRLDPLVSTLAKLFKERPVTMVRTIYALKEENTSPLPKHSEKQ